MPDVSPSLSVLMVASEVQPYSKTGGLADVIGSLPAALGRLGVEVTVVTPRYQDVEHQGPVTRQAAVQIGDRTLAIGFVEEQRGPRDRVVFVECDELYDRSGLYGVEGRDHEDNAIRFAALSHAALVYAEHGPTLPSVLHAHDWQAGMAPVLARYGPRRGSRWHDVGIVFTIHNLAYQGLFPSQTLGELGLGPELFSLDGLEFWGQIGFLKGGIGFADGVTTVSRAYARQMQTPEHGQGLDGLLRHRRPVVSGILNGIDTAVWNPERDPYLPESFSRASLAGKRAAKRALLQRYGLATDETAIRRPVVGMVSRMVDQKGLDLIREARSSLVELGATFTVLGTGAAVYEDMWRELAAAYPSQFGVRIGFDEELAHLVEGGADLFLMPSRFEPCGLNQMYSMRYGTIPVVRATGGLEDTVVPFDPVSGTGTGFAFRDYSVPAMLAAVRDALGVYATPARWRVLQTSGMGCDFSWGASAAAYVQVYERAIARRMVSNRGRTTYEE